MFSSPSSLCFSTSNPFSPTLESRGKLVRGLVPGCLIGVLHVRDQDPVKPIRRLPGDCRTQTPGCHSCLPRHGYYLTEYRRGSPHSRWPAVKPTFVMQRPRKSLDGLPAELVDEVLSYLHDPDLATLRCCSLICTSWRIRSQLIIFKHVFLWNESRLQTWCATIPPSPAGISSFVRTLELGGRWIRPQFLEQHITHLASLRNVRTLDLHDVDLKPFNEITFPRHFGQFGSSVQSLRLESCRSSTDTYLELLKHFTRLDDLFVSDTSSTKDPGVVVELRGMSGKNGTVRIEVDLDKATMPLWLSKIPWKVQEAKINVTTKSGKPFALDTLLASPAHHLQRLHVKLTKPRALRSTTL